MDVTQQEELEHPSLKLAVTDEQRDRASRWLQDAYLEGRIDKDEFDRRLGLVIAAITRRDLNEAFIGLVRVPAAEPSYPTYQPHGTERSGRGFAAFAHFGGLFSWIVVPLLVFLVSPRRSYPRREAAKAFNFQLLAGIAMVAVGIVGMILPHGLGGTLAGLIWLGWLIGTVFGGARAAAGEDWTNPVKRLVRVDVLPENDGA